MKSITCEWLAGARFSSLKEIIKLKNTSVAIALMVLVTSLGYPQELKTHQDRNTPVFKVEVWGHILSDFNTRVWSYFDLRSELEKRLPPRRVTDDPAEIRRAVRALANRIRAARAETRQGDIFTPAMGNEFRKALFLEMSAPTWAAINGRQSRGSLGSD